MLDLEQQLFKQIEKAQSILIVFPADWDSDAVASGLALFSFLKKLGLNVEIAGYREKDAPHPLSFLPGYNQVQGNLSNLRRFIVSVNTTQAKVNQIKYTVDDNKLNFIISPLAGWFKPEDVTSRAGEFKYDLIITLGAPDLESLGKIYDDGVEFFYKITVLNIDNHPANEDYGQVNFVDLNAAAIAEIVYYLLKNYQPEIFSEDIATCLLAGIITATKNFKTGSLTPRTLLTTSELIKLGARREEIVDRLYRSRDLNVLKLWGRVLNNLKEEDGGQIIWSQLDARDFKDTGASTGGLNDIVDELIANVPTTKIIVIFSEAEKNRTEVLIYSLKNLNALGLIKEYSPRGTIKIAQATLNKNLADAAQELLPKLQAQLAKLAS